MKIYLAVVLLVLALVDHSVAAVSVEQIVDILDYAGVLPHSSLSASVPEMEGIDSEQEHVKRCYSSAVGNQSIDIFAGKAGLIIHQIVVCWHTQEQCVISVFHSIFFLLFHRLNLKKKFFPRMICMEGSKLLWRTFVYWPR